MVEIHILFKSTSCTWSNASETVVCYFTFYLPGGSDSSVLTKEACDIIFISTVQIKPKKCTCLPFVKNHYYCICYTLYWIICILCLPLNCCFMLNHYYYIMIWYEIWCLNQVFMETMPLCKSSGLAGLFYCSEGIIMCDCSYIASFTLTSTINQVDTPFFPHKIKWMLYSPTN